MLRPKRLKSPGLSLARGLGRKIWIYFGVGLPAKFKDGKIGKIFYPTKSKDKIGAGKNLWLI